MATTRTITISQSAYDTILNELRAARDSLIQACKEEKIPLDSDEIDAQEYRAIDAAIEELL
jgi:hypothetical protein